MFNPSLFDQLVGPVLPQAQVSAASASGACWVNDFNINLPTRLLADVGWAASNYYDRARILYSAYKATGSSSFFNQANLIAEDFRDQDMIPAKGAIVANWAMTQGVALHYAVTGDANDLKALGMTADNLALPWYTNAIKNTLSTDGDNRIQAYALRAFLMAKVTASPSYAGQDWDALLRQTLGAILTTQAPSGIWRWAGQNNLVKPFMVGLLADAMVQYHSLFDPDPRILASIRKAVDYLWANDWDATSQAFYYSEGADGTSGSPGRVPSPDLNNLISQAAAWVYHQTGVVAYQTMAESIFAGGVNGSWLGGSKQFNQQYAQTFNEQYYQHAATIPVPVPVPPPPPPKKPRHGHHT